MDLSMRVDTFGADDTSWVDSRHALDTCRPVTLVTSLFTPSVHYPKGFFLSGLPLGRISAEGATKNRYGPYLQDSTEVQTVTITGAPTGGTFTLTFSGQQTAAIAFNATAATVQVALEALSNIAPGDVVVTGGPGPATPWIVTFAGQYLGTDVAQMTTTNALTGGTTPAVAVTTTTAGGAAGGADGRQVLAGHLMFGVKAPTDTSVLVGAALLEHGRVRWKYLPIPVDAAGRADVAGRITYNMD